MISTRIAYSAVLKTEQVDDLHKYQAIPPPVGSYPYRLVPEHTKGLRQKMAFHLVGDTGGTGAAHGQQKVVDEMSRQCDADEAVGFLYHLGDIAYHYGQAGAFENQFLRPFERYPAPVYAIAGNHDTDVDPEAEIQEESLEAFYTVFCNTSPRTIHFAGQLRRKSQVQPHVYWTMVSPLAFIIGLHTNVPKYGYINREQRSWFIRELRNAAEVHPEKALILCMHHAPYSADVNHGSSARMIEFLESSFDESGVRPDVVFSGHVHNYQRFRKTYHDGKTVPYIVAGAGGFEELHRLADPFDEAYQTSDELLENLSLDSYCDNCHGFLKISIEKTPFSFSIEGKYYTVPADKEICGASLFDQFSIDLTGR